MICVRVGGRFLCVERVLRSTWVEWRVGDEEMYIHMYREVLRCLVVS